LKTVIELAIHFKSRQCSLKAITLHFSSLNMLEAANAIVSSSS